MAFPHKREKIAGIVRKWIEEGKYKPGDRFPSDQELARKFRVTHITVRSALLPLVESGVLERRIGFGTIVRKPKAKEEAEATGTGLANAVGVTLPENTVSFFSELLHGIESALFPTGRPFLLGLHWELGDREEALVRQWLKQGLSRLLLVPVGGREPFYRSLLAAGVRVVFVDRSVAGVDVPCVASRDYEGSLRVTRLLVDLGHKKILHLAGPGGASTAGLRLAGFREACSGAGHTGIEDRIVSAGFFMDDGYRATKQWLQSGKPLPDAIFAANDSVAVGAIRALAERGLEVPRDVSVAGYADSDLARNFHLTTVRQFPERMGSEAVKLMISDRRLTTRDSVDIEPEIIVRTSTAAR